ncbi:MAG: beta-propeller domain-containing protein, partial [Clostridia bacterium]|nr:beta-propeller domain-containing protein [Clostridia bacterium]
MFEQNYKDAMDKITPNADVKDKVLDRIILKEELNDRRNPAIPWRVAFACVAAIAIVLGIVFVPRDSFKTTSSNAHKTLTVSKSYDEIYKLIKPQDYTSFWDYIIGDNGVIKRVVKKSVLMQDDADMVTEEIEYVTEGSVTYSDGDAETNTNGTAAPGDTSSENMNANANENESNDFSATTEQVEGVSEADIVKTDGEYIYY